jgi:hypothetical protein
VCAHQGSIGDRAEAGAASGERRRRVRLGLDSSEARANAGQRANVRASTKSR